MVEQKAVRAARKTNQSYDEMRSARPLSPLDGVLGDRNNKTLNLYPNKNRQTRNEVIEKYRRPTPKGKSKSPISNKMN